MTKNSIPSIIHPYQVAKILGISIRTAQSKLRKIKKAYNKFGTRNYVSLSEFSRYTGIPLQDILRTLDRKQYINEIDH